MTLLLIFLSGYISFASIRVSYVDPSFLSVTVVGGIIMKYLLVQCWLEEGNYPHLAQSITGVAFMGTPHHGSRIASTASIMSKIVNAATLGHALRSELIEMFQVSSTELTTISQQSKHRLQSLKIVSFYERKPLGQVMVHKSTEPAVEPR